jgi:hypothetical protein
VSGYFIIFPVISREGKRGRKRHTLIFHMAKSWNAVGEVAVLTCAIPPHYTTREYDLKAMTHDTYLS